tara:strand:- start:1511 stop:1726 length:216 start_codon:yes stop_codon:yes gene_type:complete
MFRFGFYSLWTAYLTITLKVPPIWLRANAFKTNWINYFQSCFSTPALKGETALKFFFPFRVRVKKKNFKVK